MEKKSSIFKPLLWLCLMVVSIIVFNKINVPMEKIARDTFNVYIPQQFAILIFYMTLGALIYLYAKSLDRKNSWFYLIALGIVIVFYLFFMISWSLQLNINLNPMIMNSIFMAIHPYIKEIFLLAGITLARFISSRRE